LTNPRGLLLKPSGEVYATGASRYLDSRPGGREPLPRIYVQFRPEGATDSYLALLDSGAHYCILHPEVVEEIGSLLTDSIGRTELLTPYGLVRGKLYVHRIEFVSEMGETLSMDATVLVSPKWNGPNFVGYAGCLDRFCFSVSPGDNLFYFGPL